MRSLKTEAPFVTRSNSSPCPHASWNIVPPEPLFRTTVNTPDGAGRARELRERTTGRVPCDLLDLDVVEELPADRLGRHLVPGLHAGVTERDRVHHQAGADHLVAREHTVGVRNQDPAPRVAVRDRDLADRGPRRTRRGIAAEEQIHLRGLRDLDRGAQHQMRSCDRQTGEHDFADTTAAPTCRGGRGRRRCCQTGLAQVARVREARRVAADDPDACAPLPTAGQLLDTAVIQDRTAVHAVLDEHLGEPAAGAQRDRKRPRQEIRFDQHGHIYGHAGNPSRTGGLRGPSLAAGRQRR